jgi:hypothetical protein
VESGKVCRGDIARPRRLLSTAAPSSRLGRQQFVCRSASEDHSPPSTKRARTDPMGDDEHTARNGDGVPTPPAFSSFDKSDVARLLAQALCDLGYKSVAKALEAAAGVQAEAAVISQIRAACLDGRWDELDRLLEALDMKQADAKKACCFLVLEQKLLELLEDGKTALALMCLRQQLAPLKTDDVRLQQLSCAIMASDPNSL